MIGDRINLTSALVAYMAAVVVSIAPGASAINKLDAIDIPSPDAVIAMLDRSVPVRESLSIQNKLLGKKAPDLHLAKWINAEQEKVKWPTKKPTLLWFWDLHCGVCRSKIKEMGEWVVKVEEMGGRFISIHTYVDDDELVSLRKLLEENDYKHNVAIDQYCDEVLYGHSRTFHSFGIGMIPICVTVSADGRILSYSHIIPKSNYWDELVKRDSTKFEPDPIEEIRPSTLMPSTWIIKSALPNLSVNQRFLLYRPDTPKLKIRMLKSSDPNVVMTYEKHSDQGQNVFVLLGQTIVPTWSKVRKGTIDVEVEYGNKSDTFEIPFIIAGKPLLAGSPPIFLGIVEKGKEVVKNIVLQSNVLRENLKLRTIHTPNEITVELPESFGKGCGEISVRIRFHTSEVGTYREVIKLKAVYEHANCEQLIELKYTAIVHD